MVLPSEVLDLSRWHLTTPEDSGDGDAEQIDQPDLDDYDSEYFEVDEDGFVVFTAPVEGFTTSGESGATRSELREHEAGSYDNSAWNPLTTGRRQLTVTCRVDGTSIDGPVDGSDGRRQEVIFFQIHGASGTPPIYLTAEWTSSGAAIGTPRVRMFVSGSGLSNANLVSPITPTSDISVRCRVEDATLKLWCVLGTADGLPSIDSTPHFTTPCSAFTDKTAWYFKHGAYNKTKIGVGASGDAITRTSHLELLQPSDDEPVESTTYELAGGSAASVAGSGARALVPAVVHTLTGSAGAVAAGSGPVEAVSATTYDRTGSAASVAAGSGTGQLSPAASYALTGGSSAIAAGLGTLALDEHEVLDRAGGAAATAASAGAVATSGATVYDEVGGVAAGAAGSGSVDLVHATTYDLSGAAAALVTAAGAGEVEAVGGVNVRGAAALTAAGSGTLEVDHPTTTDRAGGAAGTLAVAGALSTGTASTYDRAGAAATSAVAGGAIVLGTPATHVRSGGASARGAAGGELEHGTPTVYNSAGGASALGASSGSTSVVSATVFVRSGGGVVTSAGIAVLELIEPVTYNLTGGAAGVLAAAGRGRRGGRMRAAVPVAIGQFRAGTPVRR